MNSLLDGLDTRPATNFPPEIDTSTELRERLRLDHAALFDRFVGLGVGVSGFTETIDNEDSAKECSDFIGQIGALIDKIEKTHETEKADVLKIGRVYDDVFLRKRDTLREWRKTLQHRLNRFQTAMRDAARRDQEARKRAAEEAHRIADEKAAQARAEAARLAQIDRAAAREMIQFVEEHEREAALAQAVIDQPPEKGQIRGDFGSLSYLKEVPRYELENIYEVPLGYLKLDDAAIRADLAKGVRAIPGLRVWIEETTITKGR